MIMNNTFHYLDEIHDFLGQQVVMEKNIRKRPRHKQKMLSKKALGQDAFIMTIVSIY